MNVEIKVVKSAFIILSVFMSSSVIAQLYPSMQATMRVHNHGIENLTLSVLEDGHQGFGYCTASFNVSQGYVIEPELVPGNPLVITQNTGIPTVCSDDEDSTIGIASRMELTSDSGNTVCKFFTKLTFNNELCIAGIEQGSTPNKCLATPHQWAPMQSNNLCSFDFVVLP